LRSEKKPSLSKKLGFFCTTTVRTERRELTMGKQFEIVFLKDGITIVVDLLETEAPLSCEALWKGLEQPHHDKIHHGGNESTANP